MTIGRKFKIFCAIFFIFSLFMTSCKHSAKKLYNDDVVIIFTNDIRCSVKAEKGEDESSSRIGYAKIKAFKNNTKNITGSKVLLVDTGNFAHTTGDASGSVYALWTLGSGVVDFMLDAGYDYVVPGKQEFSYGIDKLSSYTRATRGKIKFLCSNLKKPDDNNKKLNLIDTDYVVEDFNGTKVALIGVTTPEVNEMKVEGYSIYDMDNTYSRLRTVIADAKNAGAEYVVVLASIGQDDDAALKILNAVGDIDVFLDGNSKVGMSTEADNTITPTTGPSRGKPVYYGHTGRNGTKVGLLTIKNPSDPTSAELKIEYLNSNALSVEESSLKKLIDTKLSDLEKNTTQMVATLTENLSIGRCGLPSDFDTSVDDKNNIDNISSYQSTDNCQSYIGSLVADGFRVMAKARVGIANASTFDTKYSVVGSSTTSKLTVYDCYKLMPFANYIGTIDVSASELKAIMECGLAKNTANGLSYAIDGRSIKAGNGRELSNGFLQVSGMKVEIDASREVGSKVKSISLLNTNGSGYDTPLTLTDTTKNITLALPDYLAYGGGDQSSPLYPNGNNHPFKPIKDKNGNTMTDAECLVEYVQGPLNQSLTTSSTDSTGRLVFGET